METIAGTSSDFPKRSELVTKMKHVTDNELPSSVHEVMSNSDLLIEILLRLPVISLLLFKSVSKHWLSLITCPKFILRRSLIPNIDPPSGLFIQSNYDNERYEFVPLDIRIPATSSRFRTTMAGSNTYVLQSCNGLLFCRRDYEYYYVYNPSINHFKPLPQPHDFNFTTYKYITRMYFDPTKSPHYKIMHLGYIHKSDVDFNIQIQTYSSETRKWSSVCSDRLPIRYFSRLHEGIYWNDAIHWLFCLAEPMHYKLGIVNEVLILTKIQLPTTLDRIVPSDRILFESHGCLLLLGMDRTHSQQLNIYEMSYEYSEWSFKYFVNLDEIIRPLPEKWSIYCGVRCVALGERDEDSFIVIGLNERVFLYKIVLKAFCELDELEYVSSTDCLVFTASFASV